MCAFVNIDNPSDKFQVQFFGCGVGSHDSGVAKAITRAVNSALFKIFCLENFDSFEDDHIEVETEEDQKITETQLENILELAKGNQKKFERILELLQIEDVAEIKKNNYDEIVVALRNDSPRGK